MRNFFPPDFGSKNSRAFDLCTVKFPRANHFDMSMVSHAAVVSMCIFVLLSLLGSSVQGYVTLNLSSESNGTTMMGAPHNHESLVTVGSTKSSYFGMGRRKKKTSATTTNNFISLPLHNCGGNAYFTTPITVGGQLFNVVVDTGSKGFWVYDACLNNNEEERRVQLHPGQKDDVFERHFYDREKSLSYSPDMYVNNGEDRQFTRKYASGLRVFGSIMTHETVKIGDAVVKQIPFATVTSLGEGGMALSGRFDGIMGLSSNNDASSGSTSLSPIEKMVQEQIVDREIVSFHITSAQSGRLIIGGIDGNLFVGKLEYIRAVPLDISRKWLVEGCRLKYGEQGVGDDLVAGAKFHFDSGASRIRIPPQAYRDLVEQIPGIRLKRPKKVQGEILRRSKIATLRCDAIHTLANLEIEIINPSSSWRKRKVAKVKNIIGGGGQSGTTVISFSPHEYFEEDPDNEGWCNLLVIRGTPDKWRIGLNPFFRKYYVAFDYNQRTIGFAPSADDRPTSVTNR